MKQLLIACVLVTSGCASAPTSLSPTGQRTYQANQAVVAIGMVQHVAIDLNQIQVCPPAPCHPLLSDTNTGVVVDNVASALKTVRAVPGGWKLTIMSALVEMGQRLDAEGHRQLGSYIQTAVTVVSSLTGGTP